MPASVKSTVSLLFPEINVAVNLTLVIPSFYPIPSYLFIHLRGPSLGWASTNRLPNLLYHANNVVTIVDLSLLRLGVVLYPYFHHSYVYPSVPISIWKRIDQHV